MDNKLTLKYKYIEMILLAKTKIITEPNVPTIKDFKTNDESSKEKIFLISFVLTPKHFNIATFRILILIQEIV